MCLVGTGPDDIVDECRIPTRDPAATLADVRALPRRRTPSRRSGSRRSARSSCRRRPSRLRAHHANDEAGLVAHRRRRRDPRRPRRAGRVRDRCERRCARRGTLGRGRRASLVPLPHGRHGDRRWRDLERADRRWARSHRARARSRAPPPGRHARRRLPLPRRLLRGARERAGAHGPARQAPRGRDGSRAGARPRACDVVHRGGAPGLRLQLRARSESSSAAGSRRSPGSSPRSRRGSSMELAGYPGLPEHCGAAGSSQRRRSAVAPGRSVRSSWPQRALDA